MYVMNEKLILCEYYSKNFCIIWINNQLLLGFCWYILIIQKGYILIL